MAQPPGYERQYNFTQRQIDKPFDPLPGDEVDNELNAAKATLDALNINIDLLQRDDGELENRIVGKEQLKDEVLTGFGQLTPQRTKRYIFDIASGGVNSVTGADRNGETLAYVAPNAPFIVGSQVDMYVDGVQEDFDNLTATDGTSVERVANFPNPSVVVIHIGEAEYVPTTDIEKLDDISPLFNGVTATFPMAVGSQPRVANLAARLDVYLDFGSGAIIQEPGVDFTVTGSDITFTTPPPTGTVWWATLRTLITFGAGSLITSYYADRSVTGQKIALNTILEENLAFDISQIPVGGQIDYIDNVIPSEVPAGTLVFPVGQTCGKCGSGANIEDDDIQIFFDRAKKFWGNLGTEDFDNLDVVALPDYRGTVMVVPDKGAGKLAAFNTHGTQDGLELLPTRRLVGSAFASGSTDSHALTINEMPIHDHDSAFGLGAGGAFVGNPAGSADNKPKTGTAGGGQGHDHTATLAVDHSNLYTNTDRIMQPYTVVEKLLRIK